MKKPLPSGAEMWAKTDNVKAHVLQLLQSVPGTRGDDRLLEYYHRVRYEGWTPWRPLSNNAAIEMVRNWVSAESIIRRRAEIQNEKNPDGSWKNPELRPKERTQRKRGAREEAATNYYGVGGYRLTDFVSPEEIA